MPRLRRHEREDLDRCGWWWNLYDLNAGDKTWSTDGKRTYPNQLAIAIHNSLPHLSYAVLIDKCEALWEACIHG